jgi:addiction module RelE/StbE family toxin
MLRKVIWTLRAHNDRKEIFEYWNNRNKSNSYSLKLNEMLKIILSLICQHPLIGKKTNKENIRAKILKDYLIIYEITDKYIIVLTIWNCRQNPDDLHRMLKL